MPKRLPLEVSLLIKVKRVYDLPEEDDCFRILVDRLWPRGLSKQKAKLDFWMKDVAPTNDLRHWYSHEPEKWQEFQKKYKEELKPKQDLLLEIKRLEKEKGTVTLVYSSKESNINNAVALKVLLEEK
jgi:uncharacterized protein YeaO (DUF488 family)